MASAKDNNLSEFDKLPNSALIRLSTLQALIPLSRVAIWRRVRDGQFPKPVQLPGSPLLAWSAGDVRQLLAEATSKAGKRAPKAKRASGGDPLQTYLER